MAALCQDAAAKPQQAERESCPKMCLLQAERCQKISVIGIKSLYYNFITLRKQVGNFTCAYLVTPEDKNNPCNPQNISGAALKTQLIPFPLVC